MIEADHGPSCRVPRERNRPGYGGLWWPSCYSGHALERHVRERGWAVIEVPHRWDHVIALGV